ncbi:MAG: hypothetical protein NT062_32985 [Proteobacteria bacterium]|nr:hypothetical protein [Pseudomonadota bacterium]
MWHLDSVVQGALVVAASVHSVDSAGVLYRRSEDWAGVFLRYQLRDFDGSLASCASSPKTIIWHSIQRVQKEAALRG